MAKTTVAICIRSLANVPVQCDGFHERTNETELKELRRRSGEPGRSIVIA